MGRLKWVFIFFIVQLLYPLSIKAQDTLVYPTDDSFVDIAAYCSFFKDEKSTLDFEQIKNLPDSVFKKLPKGSLSFGNTTASVWVKFAVKNQTKEPLYLTFWGFGVLYLDAYTYNEKGELTVRQSGTYRPFMNRDLKRGHIALNIGQSPKVVYINLKSIWSLHTLVSLSALKPLSDTYYIRDTFNGICMGILIAMALYNLFLFFSVRERLYLYYFAYILVALVSVSELNSTYRFFIGWGGAIGLRESFLIMGVIFTMHFLNTRTMIPWGHKILWGFIGLLCLSFIFSLLEWQPFANEFYNAIAGIVVPIVPILGILAYRRGNKSALFYTIAWSNLVVFGSFVTLINMNIIPFTFWTNSAFAIGTCIETILLAFALAYRLKTYRDVSEKAQKLAIERLEENEKLVNEQNKVLEEKVTERTEDLQNTLTQLQNTESQLVQSEKMAVLGELTAGIAHEINNPVNFISSSIIPLKRNLAAIEQLVVQYRSLTPTNFEEKIKEIKAFEAEMDYDYTKEEISLLTSSINDGATRTAEIVKGLRNFSRTDEGEKRKASVNEGLESTLLLMQSAFKKKNIQLIKELGNLPEIYCFVGQLNQVFMNILTNAVQAMTEKGTITVKSFVDKSTNTVKISIADTGKGMTEEVKSKIFQPFFTTKKVGEGTGLGLSISFGIIKKHDGQIEVESTVGKGTIFTITLPIGVKIMTDEWA